MVLAGRAILNYREWSKLHFALEEPTNSQWAGFLDKNTISNSLLPIPLHFDHFVYRPTWITTATEHLTIASQEQRKGLSCSFCQKNVNAISPKWIATSKICLARGGVCVYTCSHRYVCAWEREREFSDIPESSELRLLRSSSELDLSDFPVACL